MSTTTTNTTLAKLQAVRESIAKAASSIEDVTGIYAEHVLAQSGVQEYPKEQPLAVFDNVCREGILTLKLQELQRDRPQDTFQVTCGDFTDTMIDLAKQRVQQEGWKNTTVVKINPESIPLPPSSFTHIFTNFGIMTFPSPSQTLKELHRLLRPGGICAFTTWASIPWYADMKAAVSSVPELPAIPEPSDIETSLPNIFSPEKIWHDPKLIHQYLEQQHYDFVDVQSKVIPAVSVSSTLEGMKKLVRPPWTLVTRFYWTQEQREKFDNDEMFEKMFEWWEEKLRRDSNGEIRWDWSAVVTVLRKG